MKLFASIINKAKFGLTRMIRETSLVAEQKGALVAADTACAETVSKHRNIIPLYDLKPMILVDTYIAPNATVAGEVLIGQESSVWYGAVIRGDINSVRIGNNSSIGDNTVIHTAASLPTGMPASVSIGSYVTVQHGCTLYSCHIEDECLIGFKSVVLEGAKIEHGSVIGPNSVVPPGRLIPSHQLWAGNPVEYIRDLTKGEVQNLIHGAKQNLQIALEHKYEFLPYNSAYLFKENSENDLNPTQEEIRDRNIVNELDEESRSKDRI